MDKVWQYENRETDPVFTEMACKMMRTHGLMQVVAEASPDYNDYIPPGSYYETAIKQDKINLDDVKAADELVNEKCKVCTINGRNLVKVSPFKMKIAGCKVSDEILHDRVTLLDVR